MGPTPLDPGWRIALACLAWLAGVVVQTQQPELWPPWVDPACIGLAALLGWCGWRGRGGTAWGAPLLAAALAAAGTTGWRAQQWLAESHPSLEGVDLMLTGVVANLPQTGPAGTRFVLEVELAARLRPGADDAVALRVPPRVALGWFTLVQQPKVTPTLSWRISCLAFSANSGQFEAGSTTTARASCRAGRPWH